MKKLLFVCACFLLSGCQKEENNSDYSIIIEYDYKDVEHLHIEWKDVLSQEAINYYVYIYSLTCGHCKEAKPYILEAALNSDRSIYFVSYTKEIPIITNAELNIGVTNYEELGIIGTPTLFEIESNMVSACYTGSVAIIETLTNNYYE